MSRLSCCDVRCDFLLFVRSFFMRSYCSFWKVVRGGVIRSHNLATLEINTKRLIVLTPDSEVISWIVMRCCFYVRWCVMGYVWFFSYLSHFVFRLLRFMLIANRLKTSINIPNKKHAGTFLPINLSTPAFPH